MSILKNLFNPELKEQFEIKDIRASEFAERLQPHVDENPKDFLSRSKSEFYGKVGKDSFKLSVNKLVKLEDATYYGKFYGLQGKLILDVRFSPPANQKAAPFIIITLGFVFAVGLFINEAITWYSPLIFLAGFGIAALSVHLARSNEIEELIKLFRRIFDDKEITLIKSTMRGITQVHSKPR